MTLNKKSFQNFMKRLRKLYPPKHPIKYYACGEYGTQTERPHYHAIIFNVDPDKIQKAWHGNYYIKDIYGKYTDVSNGLTHCDTVTQHSIAYVAKYINKGKLIPKHKNDDRLPEFQLFSKGLGANYLTSETVRYHKQRIGNNYVTIDGFKKPLPRYFKDKIFDEAEKLAIQEIALEQANQTYIKQYNEYLENKSRGQTFEEYRFSRKKNALEHFKQALKSRNKL